MSNRIGLIAEDDSDVDVIDELIKKLTPRKNYSLKKFLGYGCGKIRGKCFQWATDLGARGCNMLIVLHDLDDRASRELEIQLRQALNSQWSGHRVRCFARSLVGQVVKTSCAISAKCRQQRLNGLLQVELSGLEQSPITGGIRLVPES